MANHDGLEAFLNNDACQLIASKMFSLIPVFALFFDHRLNDALQAEWRIRRRVKNLKRRGRHAEAMRVRQQRNPRWWEHVCPINIGLPMPTAGPITIKLKQYTRHESEYHPIIAGWNAKPVELPNYGL